MDQPQDLPLLFSFYFGDSAARAQRGASRRFKKWCRAFEFWMERRRSQYQKDTVKQATMAWKRLIRQCGKMPWEMRKEDIDEHATWMKEEGFAMSTINCSIGIIEAFYSWCDENRIDQACPMGFNPAKEATRMRVRRYEGANLWTMEEMEMFLELLGRDETELGKREQAFFVARLNLGVSLKQLLSLRWGQLEQDVTGTWVWWRQDGKRTRLPEQVWRAIKEWLEASGRLEGMEAGKYIFTPLAYPGKEARGGKAEDWLEGQPLSNAAILASLKLYGRRTGIVEEKLTLMALRRTAIRMRMNRGENLEGMKAFMDSREETKSTKYRLGWMPEIIEEETLEVENRKREMKVPEREAKPFKEGENLTHGYYSHKMDMQAVRAVMAENIHGMQQEIACLRSLMNLILEHHGDEASLVDSYTRAASRLAELIKATELVKEHKKDSWAYEALDDLDRIAARLGQPPCSQQIREQAMGLSSSAGHVTVEIASIRLLLRNLYQWALQEVDTHAYLHLVDLYGSGCVRLAKLLKLGGGDEAGNLERMLNEALNEAIRQVHEELQSGWQINSG